MSANRTHCAEVNGCSDTQLALTMGFLPVSLIPSHPPIHRCLHHLTLRFSFLSYPTFSFSIYGVLASLPPQGLHAEFIFIFPFHNFLSPKSLLNWQLFSLFPCCTSPTPPLHPLISTLQLLFWISQIAPVRSSDPSPLPPTELHRTLHSLIFCLPPQSLSHARAQKPYWYFWQVRVKVLLEAGLWGCRAFRGLCRLSFFSCPGRRDGAGVPFTPLSNKRVCYSKPDKELHKFLLS